MIEPFELSPRAQQDGIKVRPARLHIGGRRYLFGQQVSSYGFLPVKGDPLAVRDLEDIQ